MRLATHWLATNAVFVESGSARSTPRMVWHLCVLERAMRVARDSSAHSKLEATTNMIETRRKEASYEEHCETHPQGVPHTATPYLIVTGAANAIEFYKRHSEPRR